MKIAKVIHLANLKNMVSRKTRSKFWNRFTTLKIQNRSLLIFLPLLRYPRTIKYPFQVKILVLSFFPWGFYVLPSVFSRFRRWAVRGFHAAVLLPFLPLYTTLLILTKKMHLYTRNINRTQTTHAVRVASVCVDYIAVDGPLNLILVHL